MPEGSKTASHQELLQNPSESALYAHTLHTCSSQKCFAITIFEKTRMSRGRVQSKTFWDDNVEFRWGFAIGVGSTTIVVPKAWGMKLSTKLK